MKSSKNKRAKQMIWKHRLEPIATRIPELQHLAINLSAENTETDKNQMVQKQKQREKKKKKKKIMKKMKKKRVIRLYESIESVHLHRRDRLPIIRIIFNVV